MINNEYESYYSDYSDYSFRVKPHLKLYLLIN